MKRTLLQSHMPRRGYTIDQLRYERALNLARTEIARIRIAETYSAAKNTLVGGDETPIFGNICGSFGYLRYIVMGYRMWKKISNFIQAWRK